MNGQKLFSVIKDIRKGIDLLSVRAESRTLMFIIIVLLVSCRNVLKTDSSPSVLNEEIDTVVDSIPSEIKPSNEFIIDKDCIFDLSTQTDEFLRGIKELEGYIWNAETKIAEVHIANDCTLKIHRGGCDHFYMSATFEYHTKIEFETNKDLIFEKIIWIASLIEDLDGNIVAEAIEKNKYVVNKEDGAFTFVNLIDERLYESYFIFHEIDNDNTSFGVTYSID